MSWSQVTFSAWVRSAIDAVTSTVRPPVVLTVAAWVSVENGLAPEKPWSKSKAPTA